MLNNIIIMLNNITFYYVEYQVQNKGWDIWTSLPPVGTMSQVSLIFDFATFPQSLVIIGQIIQGGDVDYIFGQYFVENVHSTEGFKKMPFLLAGWGKQGAFTIETNYCSNSFKKPNKLFEPTIFDMLLI